MLSVGSWRIPRSRLKLRISDCGSRKTACCRIWARWLSSCAKAPTREKRSKRWSNTFDCNPRIDEEDGNLTVRPELRFERPAPARQAVELCVGVLTRTLRTFLGDPWKPHAVCFTHGAPRGLSVHKRIFGSRVEFGCDFNGIVCKAEDLEQQVSHSDQLMARYVRQYLDALLINRELSMSDRVRELLWIRVPSGTYSLEAMAKQLGVSGRTIERQLKQDGTSFSALLNQVRAEMVRQYVESAGRPLYDVAELMGFSALSAFSRWFRDEFGCSPSEWRATAGRRRGAPENRFSG
jgi:AraC-like DNA-binding protein